MRAIVLSCGIWASSIAFASAVAISTPHVQLPQQFTNLQVLPKDIAQRELVQLMRSFALGLGVRCEHCHRGEGNDLSQFDFASDARPAKAIARRMIQMTRTINTEHLSGVGEPSETPKVTCFTCHRGTTKPATAAPAGSGSLD